MSLPSLSSQCLVGEGSRQPALEFLGYNFFLRNWRNMAARDEDWPCLPALPRLCGSWWHHSAWYHMEMGRQGAEPELCSPGRFDGSLVIENICWMRVRMNE